MNKEEFKEKLLADLKYAEYCLGICRNSEFTPYQHEVAEHYGLDLPNKQGPTYNLKENLGIVSHCHKMLRLVNKKKIIK